MKLVITGAGASFDCISEPFDGYDKSGYRPPLANSILDTNPIYRTIIGKYPGARAHHSEANTIDDIEDFFQAKWKYLTSVRDDNLVYTRNLIF